MRKIFATLACAALAAVSCQMEEQFAPETPKGAAEIAVAAEQPAAATKTSLGASDAVLWSADDQLAAFGTSALAAKKTYSLTSGEGTSDAVFAGEALSGTGAVAVYPASIVAADAAVSENAGVYTVPVTVPATQTYTAGSFPAGSLIMAGAGDGTLAMKNVLGVLELKVWHASGYTVSQIEITASEPLAGNAEISLSSGGAPTMKFVSDTTKTIVVNFATPIALSKNEEAPTLIYVPAPVGAFAKGFTATFHNGAGTLFSFNRTAADNGISRATIKEMPTLKIAYSFSSTVDVTAGATASDTKINYSVTAGSSEYYYSGAYTLLEKAKYLNGEGKVDTTAVVAEIRRALDANATKLYKAGTYNTMKDAYTSLLKKGNRDVSVTGLKNNLTYLCCAVGFDLAGTLTSGLKYTEAKTTEHIFVDAEGANFTTDDSMMSFVLDAKYGYSTTKGVFNPTNYFGFTMMKTGSENITFVKYARFKLSDYKTRFAALDSSVASDIETYFTDNGSSVSDANLAKINGSGFSAGYTACTPGESYVEIVIAKTATKTMIAASTIKMPKAAEDWFTLTADSGAQYYVQSSVPVASARYGRVGGNTSTTYTYSTLTSATMGSNASATVINALNSGAKASLKYSSASASKQYYLIMEVTNKAGDVATRAVNVWQASAI